MRNFKVTIWYCGSAYHGWQIQNNSLTIQEIFQKCLSDLLDQPTAVNGCSRTDAGVHAREYVLNFTTDSTITCRGIVFGMNSRLPDDIGVKSCEEVPLDFHARFDCKGKEYEYLIHNSEYKNPFYMNTAYRSWYPINEKKLDRAAKDFIGDKAADMLENADELKKKVVEVGKSIAPDSLDDKVEGMVDQAVDFLKDKFGKKEGESK